MWNNTTHAKHSATNLRSLLVYGNIWREHRKRPELLRPFMLNSHR